MACDEDEIDEVKSLLTRHRLMLIKEFNDSNLIDILIKNDIINNVIDQELINNVGDDDNEKKCDYLIDFISKNGFIKFKEFCYAIENDCPLLITDLINDKLKHDPENNQNMENNDDEIIITNRDTIDSNRSRRSTSYCGSITPTPISLSRRSSLAFSSSQTHTPTLPQQQQPIINPNMYPQNGNGNGNVNVGIYGTTQNPLNSQIQNMNSNYNPSPILSTKMNDKLHHRYSTTILEDIQQYNHGIPERRMKRNKLFNRGASQIQNETIEVLAEPVVEDDALGERTSWEYHTVTVTRVPGYGFGIAVSGGRDNPHFANGDPSIAVSDVLKAGPAEDRLQVNDRIISVNGVSLENVEYATAVQVLRDSGNTVTLVIKRRVPNLNMLPQTNHHSHQHSHSLSSTGLGIGNNIVNISGGMLGGVGVGGIGVSGLGAGGITQIQQPQQTIKLFLTKANKKDDFGIVLGCRLFIKEISSKARDQLASNGYALQEGDIVSRIHNTNCNDAMSLKESKKIIDGCKERLNLVVLREIPSSTTTATTLIGNNSGMQSPVYSHTAQVSNCSNNIDETFLPGGPSYSAQNLYVQPPTRPAISTLLDDKSNLTPRGRSRGPLMDVSLSQLDRPSTPQGSHIRSRSGIDEPPRPPPPRGEDFYSSRRQLYDDDPLQRSKQSAEPRFISFQKEGSVGIRLTGGNEAGIFVTAVQPGSPASLQGLTPGDKILKVNEMDMNGFTREEAVLFLLSLQDRIDLIVQHCKDEYDTVVANQRGDSFHIKTHFHYENPSKGEMSFKAGDVFRVIDTLHNGVVGSWQVLRIGRGQQEMQRGVIPNKSRAEELATAQFNQTKKEMNASESRGNFFRRRRSTHRRSKSLSRENWDDVVFSDSISKFPAYERVVLRHPGFVRPVVLFGAVSDIARDRLIKDFPDKFTAPLQDDGKNGNANKSGIVRLSNIRDIMDRGKHALLDITPNAVDRLNYAQFYPIVIFLKADTKHIIKQLRQGIPKSAHKSSKKLLEQCQKLERVWSHVFSTSITLNDADIWYRKLRESVDQQQSGAVWMSETKLVELPSDIFLPYLPPPCPCCTSSQHQLQTSYSSHSQPRPRRPQTPLRYSLPITPPPSLYSQHQNQQQQQQQHHHNHHQQQQQPFQIISIKNQQQHSNSMPGLYNLNNKSNSLLSFKSSVPNLEQISSSNKNLIEHRSSPYYYNELTINSLINSTQFDSNLDINHLTQLGDSSDETLFEPSTSTNLNNQNNNNQNNQNLLNNNTNIHHINTNNNITNNNNNNNNEINLNHEINNNHIVEHEHYLGFV